MKFGEKLRLVRGRRHMTQEELARRLGLSKRTVEGYESGAFYPRKRQVYDQLAALFGVDKKWFLTEDDEGGDAAPGEEEARRVLEAAKALYAGGALSQQDKDALAQALMDAYWMAKSRQAGDKE